MVVNDFINGTSSSAYVPDIFLLFQGCDKNGLDRQIEMVLQNKSITHHTFVTLIAEAADLKKPNTATHSQSGNWCHDILPSET